MKKIGIELVISEMPDGISFLNYWDNENGNDVSCEITDGKLLLQQYDDESHEMPSKEISFVEFIELVKSKVDAPNIYKGYEFKTIRKLWN